MKKIVFLVISLIIGIMVYKKNDEIIIPTDAIRIRIIANSNSISDLYQKKLLKEEITSDLYNYVKNANSSKEALDSINSNFDKISEIVSKKTSDFKLNIGKNFFPEKAYKGVIYPAGEYDSLVITLGSGLGDNWWCVLYPPLCLINDNDSTGDVEYRLMVQEILSN